jgi:hypothetical protein
MLAAKACTVLNPNHTRPRDYLKEAIQRVVHNAVMPRMWLSEVMTENEYTTRQVV